MNINNKKNIFLKLYQEMLEINQINDSIIYQEKFNNWMNQLQFNLEDKLYEKIKCLVFETSDLSDDNNENFIVQDKKSFGICEKILKDQIYKFSNNKTKEFLEIIKLIKARENNSNFDLMLSEMICGDNKKFPHRTLNDIDNFFNKLGYSYSATYFCNKIEKEYTLEIIESFSTENIYKLISEGLFDKKYFIDYANSRKEGMLSIDNFYEEAKREFGIFIKNSLVVDDKFNLSSVLEMNINIELLNDIKPNTNDNELNLLIKEAVDRFYDISDKQIAIEKLWDAFERLKTHFSKDKKNSSSQLVKMISENFDLILINEEFNILTKIGNNYRIRHHEIDKKELTEQHRNYFFFRMLSLIDLCLSFINKEEIEVDLF